MLDVESRNPVFGQTVNPSSPAHGPGVPPLVWRLQSLAGRSIKNRLRTGFCIDDGKVKPSAAVVRGLERAARALRERGCDVIPFTPPRIREVIYLQS